jgi:hypothetical protein
MKKGCVVCLHSVYPAPLKIHNEQHIKWSIKFSFFPLNIPCVYSVRVSWTLSCTNTLDSSIHVFGLGYGCLTLDLFSTIFELQLTLWQSVLLVEEIGVPRKKNKDQPDVTDNLYSFIDYTNIRLWMNPIHDYHMNDCQELLPQCISCKSVLLFTTANVPTPFQVMHAFTQHQTKIGFTTNTLW